MTESKEKIELTPGDVKIDELGRVHVLDGGKDFVFVLRNNEPFLVTPHEVSKLRYDAIFRKAAAVLRRLEKKI